MRETSELTKNTLDWSALYVSDKRLWANEDAQDYVNRLREDH